MKKQTKQTKKKLHLRKGDSVFVLSGNEKGKTGEVLRVDMEKERAVVEGLNMRLRHIKATAQNPEGRTEEFPAPIHISNLMVINPETGKPARTGRRINPETGKLERYFKADRSAHVSPNQEATSSEE
ncbi:MAG: 50S ribosomal protein L24 [Bernardetiaceae bacterium]